MVHPWGFVNSRWDPNGAPLGLCELAVEPKWCTIGIPLRLCEFVVGPQWCTLGVLRIRGRTPMVHPWGVVHSRWVPNDAPLGFFEFAV